MSALEGNEDLQTMKIEEDFRSTLKRIFASQKIGKAAFLSLTEQ